MTMFENIRSDYGIHGRSLTNLAFWAMAVYRFGRWSNTLTFRPLRWVTSKVYGGLKLMIEITSGILIHREMVVGEGFHLIHPGNIKIHPGVVFGDRCGIMQGVNFGTNMDREGVANVGDDVFIGIGATILGPVTIGNHARVAANSLVLKDVPPGATAIGVPAKILRYTGRAGSEPEKVDRPEFDSLEPEG